MALSPVLSLTRDTVEVARFLGTPRPPANSFLAKMWAQLRLERRPLSAAQASTSRRIIDQESAAAFEAHLRSLQPVVAAPVAVEVAAPVEPAGRNPGKGIYTVELDGGASWVTFRVKPSRNPRYPDMLEVLTGPDNDRSYTSIGELVMGFVSVWGSRRFPPPWIDAEAAQRLAKREDVARAMLILMGADKAGRAAAGQAYSRSTEVWNEDHTVLQSVECYRCGRTLSVPSSIRDGRGPDCLLKD